MQLHADGRTAWAWLVLTATPLFFSSNLIFGRDALHEVAPFTLAFIRWSAVCLVLLPFSWSERRRMAELVRREPGFVLLLGALAMLICGGFVYFGLARTTATNGTLIYTTSPVIIILMEAVFRGRRIGAREAVGSAIAFAGIVTIILRGDLSALLSLRFNAGDLIFVVAAIAWAAYSLVNKSSLLAGLPNMATLALAAGAGALCLAPYAAAEFVSGEKMPVTIAAWANIGGIVFFSSLLAFIGFQYGVRAVGPSVAGIFMYLLPPYGVTLAVLWLGEEFHRYHAIGIAMVMTGIVLATFPVERFRLSRAAG